MIYSIWNGYKKMTDIVKINVLFFYDIKIYTIDFDFIYL